MKRAKAGYGVGARLRDSCATIREAMARVQREPAPTDADQRLAELELRYRRREQAERNRYRSLVESIDHGFVWSAAPETLRPSFVSGAAERFTGYSAGDLTGSSSLFLSLVDGRDREAFVNTSRRALQSDTECRLEHRLRTSDGRTVWFHTGMRASIRGDGAGPELNGLSIEISALKRAEHTLACAKRRGDIISRASLILGESLDCSQSLRALMTYLQGSVFDVCLLECLELAPQHNVVATGRESIDAAVLEAIRQSPPSRSPEVGAHWAPGCRRIWRTVGEAELLEIGGNELRALALAPLGLTSCVQLGLAMRGRLLGVLTFGATGRAPLSEGDVALAEDLGYRISTALENCGLYVKAEAANRLRDEFLMVVSHELRTPLTPLKIRVQQLQRQLEPPHSAPVSDHLRRTVETCHRQVDRLTRLVGDLLDISRISRGQLSLRPEPFDLSALVAEILARLEGQLAAAGCPVLTELESPLPVRLDRPRMEQVILNLLTNAMKYAPGKPIEISARAARSGAEVSVKDHGIGIALEDQSRIFRRFERAVSSQNFGGLGLGLYLVNQILTAHGGEIEVESEPGGGARFTFRVPRDLA